MNAQHEYELTKQSGELPDRFCWPLRQWCYRQFLKALAVFRGWRGGPQPQPQDKCTLSGFATKEEQVFSR